MSIWTVKPETATIDLAYVDNDGETHKFWLKVKKHLTVGEGRKVKTAGWKGLTSADGKTGIDIDWQIQSFARAEAYIVDWSLEDDAHVKLPLTAATIESLHEDLFEVMDAAITAHVEAMEQEKKVKRGRGGPPATSD